MFLVDRIVQPETGQAPLRGLLRNVVVAENKRIDKSDRARADLIVPLIVCKYEELVFFDRTSDGSAVLPPHEERIFETLARAGEIAQRVESGRVAGSF